MVKIIEDFIPSGRRNRPGFSMRPLYLTAHDTGNANHGADAAAHARYLKSNAAASIPVSWHFTVDDKVIYQHLPLNEVGWHAGDGGQGTGNRHSIGYEVCMNSDGDRAKAEENAAWLVAYLHGRVSSLKAFSTSMKQHYDWSRKNCPQLLRRGEVNDWDSFLRLCRHYLNEEEGETVGEKLTWQQEQTIRKIRELAEMGLLNDPESHVKRVEAGEQLGDFVVISLIERLAREVQGR